jgi:hypothetical protein
MANAAGERALLTFGDTGAAFEASVTARFATALTAAILIAISSVASADGIAVGGCVGGYGSFFGRQNGVNCVLRWGQAGSTNIRQVPEASGEERSLAAERDRKWQERCKPAIAQDRYGVPRYIYAARGCEFGVIE